MHASAFFTLAVAGLAAAQTTTTSATTVASGTASGCGKQLDLIISTCLSSTQPQLQACPANDWDCMCTQSINVLTCYNNCPSSPDRFGYEQTKVANCNAASAYGTSSKATATGSSIGSSTASLSTVGAAASSTSGSPTGTVSASQSEASGTATESGAAVAHVTLPAGGLLAAVFGLAAML